MILFQILKYLPNVEEYLFLKCNITYTAELINQYYLIIALKLQTSIPYFSHELLVVFTYTLVFTALIKFSVDFDLLIT